MKQTKRRTNSGITLVALVITIIILLILAGISISALTGSGLFEKAKYTKERTEIEEAKEQAKMDIMAWTSDKLGKGEDATLDDSIVKGILTGKDYVKGKPGESSFVSKKGEHEILYSDLYEMGSVSFTLIRDSYIDGYIEKKYTVEYGTTWNEFFLQNYKGSMDWTWEKLWVSPDRSKFYEGYEENIPEDAAEMKVVTGLYDIEGSSGQIGVLSLLMGAKGIVTVDDIIIPRKICG